MEERGVEEENGVGRGKDAMVLLVSGGKEGGKWVIPGGGVEQNECAEEAARRELEEEAGVKARAVEVIGLFQDDDRKHRTTVFLMEVEEELSVWEEGEHGRRRIWLPLNVGAEVVKLAHRPILNAVLARSPSHVLQPQLQQASLNRYDMPYSPQLMLDIGGVTNLMPIVMIAHGWVWTASCMGKEYH
ncbi:hydrolase, NUDIX family [Ancylostoma ceylanicum]|uniref:Hydrolase, NUDIX family n=1 Tax=Ancylostoma ceylanicum TaxID=53326 RepID=A0A0D6LYQ2_9BILA|nr:hydrolase, NUDIX family [Ancylostoma ceylanicum]